MVTRHPDHPREIRKRVLRSVYSKVRGGVAFDQEIVLSPEESEALLWYMDAVNRLRKDL